jgi:hypothetical protein
MKTLIYSGLLLIGFAAILITSGCCTPNAIVGSQPVPLRGQETPVWCWAASGEMVMDFLGTDVSQCEQADERLGRNDCCNTPRPAACVTTGWPDFAAYDFTFDRTSNTALSWDALKRQIDCGNKPVAFSWRWNGGGGHMMVATAYAQIGGVNYVSISDPLPVNSGSQRFITYTAYVSGSTYTHWDDFYNITKKP